MLSTRERNVLIATAAVAIGVPTLCFAWVDHRTEQLASHLSQAAAVPARIGGVDADLTGTVRLSDVALGSLVSADSIEASVALESLLAGQLGADEIRVAGPKVALEVDKNGDSDLARVVRRLAHGGGHTHAGHAIDAPRLVRKFERVTRTTICEPDTERPHRCQAAAFARDSLDVPRATHFEKATTTESGDLRDPPICINGGDDQPADGGYFSKTAAYT